MDMILTRELLTNIEKVINKMIFQSGADCVLLIDRAGNIIATAGDPPSLDIMALAALSAANFGATSEIAKLIGENDFSLLFHKGDNENIHFSKVGETFILITLFGSGVSLGLIRLKVQDLCDKILEILAEKG